MSEKPVPPYRRRPSLAEKLVLNSTFGRLGNNPFLICHDYPYHPNQEKPMNQCQTPKPAYVPGDRVILNQGSCTADGIRSAKVEVVFIGFDPEQPTVALVRDVGNVNAPIRGVHNSHIKAMPPKPVERVMDCVVYAARDRIYTTNLANLNVNDLAERRASYETKKAVDAMVTKDGLVLVKYIDQPVDEAAMLAAHKNPTFAFCSARRFTTD